MVRDMLLIFQHVEKMLFAKIPELEPEFILVGSIAEGTRIYAATELDVLVRFNGLKDEKFQFKIGKNAFSLKIDHEENHPMIDFIDQQSLSLNYKQFFEFFLLTVTDIVLDSLETIKEITEGRIIFPDWYKTFLTAPTHKNSHGCPIREVDPIKGPFYTHCQTCLFPVTQTKSGACLVFKWKSAEYDKEDVLTMDLIPVLPLKECTLNELFSSVTETLLTEQPPNWLNHVKGVINRDQILPESFTREYDKRKDEPIFVGMKLINYGLDDKFIIRPAQQLEITKFEKSVEIKHIYCYVKCLKTLLNVDLSSYFIKKIILTDKMVEKGRDNIYISEGIYDVLSHPDVKAKFEEFIDYEKWTRYDNTVPIKGEKLSKSYATSDNVNQ